MHIQWTPELIGAIAAAIVLIINTIRQSRIAATSAENHTQTQLQIGDVAKLVEEAFVAANKARGASEATHQVISELKTNADAAIAEARGEKQ